MVAEARITHGQIGHHCGYVCSKAIEVVYSEAMTVWPPSPTFYTLREPVVWIGVPFLHYLLNNRIAMLRALA